MPNDLQEIREHYKGYLNRVRRALENATEETADALLARMRDLTSLQDHSLADLRRLDHPYSTRHSRGSGPHPDYEVHRQSEDGLQDGLRVEHEGVWHGGQVASEVHDDADHLWHVLQGTDRMRPRDFASAAILQELETAEARYRDAFAMTGDAYHDDGESVIEVELVDHERQAAQLPGQG